MPNKHHKGLLAHFNISEDPASDVQFVCAYLKALDDGTLPNTEILYDNPDEGMAINYRTQTAEECRRLIARHYLQGDGTMEVSYTLTQGFIKLLAYQLRGFSTTIHFRLDLLPFCGLPPSLRQTLVKDLVLLAKHFINRSNAADANKRKAAELHNRLHDGPRRAEDMENLMHARDIDENLNQALVVFGNGSVRPFFKSLETVPRGLRQYYQTYAETQRNQSLNLHEMKDISQKELVVRVQAACGSVTVLHCSHLFRFRSLSKELCAQRHGLSSFDQRINILSASLSRLTT